MQIRLTNQGFILVLIPLAVQVIFMIAFFCMLQQAENELVEEARAREKVKVCNHIARVIFAAAAGLGPRAAAAASSGSFVPSSPGDNLPVEFNKLRALSVGHPDQIAAINRFDSSWRASWLTMHELKNSVNSNSTAEVIVKFAKVQSSLQEVYRSIDRMSNYFEELQNSAPALQAENRQRQTVTLFIFLLVDVIMALGLCAYFSQQTGKRLKILLQNARSLALDKPIDKKLTGTDELAELQRTLVTMSESLAQARKKERAILDNAGDIICSLDINATFVTTSNAAERLWGFGEEELRGRRLAELIDPADWQSTREKLTEIRTKDQPADIENRVLNSSGAALDMLWRVNWSAAEKNYFCVVHDISARRQLERLKLEFMSMITHDIRSPINSVQAFLQMVSEKIYGELNEKGLNRLKSLEESVNLVSRLISNLLDLEKAESGMLVLERHDAVSTHILASSINIVSALAERKQVKLEKEGLAFDLFVDAGRVVQVMVNLISNAIKFSPQGSTVVVACRAANSQAILTVKDQGPGIKTEYQSRIFDRFEQITDHTKSSEIAGRHATGSAGTGLGLAIAKAIVEAHHGQISVESDGKLGTTFVVRLPLSA